MNFNNAGKKFNKLNFCLGDLEAINSFTLLVETSASKPFDHFPSGFCRHEIYRDRNAWCVMDWLLNAEGTDAFKGDFSARAVSAGYQYSLSKRTSVYGALSYASFEDNEDGASSVKPSAVEAGLGLFHLF